MRVLILGSGAREHALYWKARQSPLVDDVIGAPGSGAAAAEGKVLPVDVKDPTAVVGLARGILADLVVIGPDDAVAAGVADALLAEGLTVFGPTREAGRLESSKSFAKEVMQAAGVPTGRFARFDDPEAARVYAREQDRGLVVKADGLALGKGVVVCDTVEATLAAIDRAMVQRAYGDAGREVILEERLSGQELSLMCFCDGARAVAMVPARDYQRAGEGDTGPNTGGMGAYSPPPDAGEEVQLEVLRRCAEPVIAELARRGTPYRGCLYVQVMLTAEGPKVIEYNARFGDPEAQVVLPRLRSDLVEVMLASARGNLAGARLDWEEDATVGVVVASAGYPGEYQTGQRISGLDSLDPGVLAFHAGTRYQDHAFVTSGGRVLTLVASGDSVASARRRAYDNVERISFGGSFFRRDIAPG
jgi:phosphoribosylamine--glycine ligase